MHEFMHACIHADSERSMHGFACSTWLHMHGLGAISIFDNQVKHPGSIANPAPLPPRTSRKPRLPLRLPAYARSEICSAP